MAIIKDTNTQFGITASYHRLTRVEIDALRQTVISFIEVYANEEARRSGGRPLYVQEVHVPFFRFVDDPRVPFYKLLANTNDSPCFGGENDADNPGGPEFTVTPWQPAVVPNPIPLAPTIAEPEA